MQQHSHCLGPRHQLTGHKGCNAQLSALRFHRSCIAYQRRRRCSWSIRSAAETEKREQQQQIITAPPVRMPPPPPPPPPPQAPPTPPFSRRTILAALLVGAAGWQAWIRRDQLQIRSMGGEFDYITTENGNNVAISLDENGNTFMLDAAGNMYYDTGDARFGVYIVDPQGRMFNSFIDAEGQVQRTFVGNVKDLREVNIDSIGGIPMDQIRKAYEDQNGVGEGSSPPGGRPEDREAGKPDSNKLAFFPDAEHPIVVPPDALKSNEKGEVIQPRYFEEGEIRNIKRRSWMPSFGREKDNTWHAGDPWF